MAFTNNQQKFYKDFQNDHFEMKAKEDICRSLTDNFKAIVITMCQLLTNYLTHYLIFTSHFWLICIQYSDAVIMTQQ